MALSGRHVEAWTCEDGSDQKKSIEGVQVYTDYLLSRNPTQEPVWVFQNPSLLISRGSSCREKHIYKFHPFCPNLLQPKACESTTTTKKEIETGTSLFRNSLFLEKPTLTVKMIYYAPL